MVDNIELERPQAKGTGKKDNFIERVRLCDTKGLLGEHPFGSLPSVVPFDAASPWRRISYDESEITLLKIWLTQCNSKGFDSHSSCSSSMTYTNYSKDSPRPGSWGQANGNESCQILTDLIIRLPKLPKETALLSILLICIINCYENYYSHTNCFCIII